MLDRDDVDTVIDGIRKEMLFGERDGKRKAENNQSSLEANHAIAPKNCADLTTFRLPRKVFEQPNLQVPLSTYLDVASSKSAGTRDPEMVMFNYDHQRVTEGANSDKRPVGELRIVETLCAICRNRRHKCAVCRRDAGSRSGIAQLTTMAEAEFPNAKTLMHTAPGRSNFFMVFSSTSPVSLC